MENIKTAEVAGMLRKVATQLANLEEKVAEYERRDKVAQIMAKMAEKGIQAELEPEDLRKDLMKKAEEGKLAAVEEAIDMSSGYNSIKVAAMDRDENYRPSDASKAELENFLLAGNV